MPTRVTAVRSYRGRATPPEARRASRRTGAISMRRLLLGAGDDLGRVDEAQRDEQPDERRHHVDHRHGVDRLHGTHAGGEDRIIERDDQGLAVGPAVRKVSSNIAMVRTRTSSSAARMPGSEQRQQHVDESCNVSAPKTRAAASMRGSICSMNGIMTRMTKGTVGTRLASDDAGHRAGEPGPVEHGRERDAEGDRRHQQRQQEEQHHEPLAGKVAAGQRVGRRHADAGRTGATTRKTISKVTMSTSPSWNSSQADTYQRVVQPAGSQVPSQRVAKELVTTVRDHREQVERRRSRPAPRLPPPRVCRRREVVSRIMRAQPFAPPTGPR